MSMNVGRRMKVYMAGKMIGCDQAGYLVSKSKETKLNCREKIGLRFHLVTCHVCRKYAHQLNDLQHMVIKYKNYCTDETVVHLLPDETRSSLKKTLEKEMTGK